MSDDIVFPKLAITECTLPPIDPKNQLLGEDYDEVFEISEFLRDARVSFTGNKDQDVGSVKFELKLDKENITLEFRDAANKLVSSVVIKKSSVENEVKTFATAEIKYKNDITVRARGGDVSSTQSAEDNEAHCSYVLSILTKELGRQSASQGVRLNREALRGIAYFLANRLG